MWTFTLVKEEIGISKERRENCECMEREYYFVYYWNILCESEFEFQSCSLGCIRQKRINEKEERKKSNATTELM